MKILIDARSISKYSAGIGTYALNIIKNIENNHNYVVWKNYNVKVETNYKTINNFIPGRFLKKMWKKASFPSLVFLTFNKFDIYHSFEANIPPSGSKINIITVHDLAYKIDSDFYPIKYSEKDEIEFQKVLDKADAIVSVSHNTKVDLIKFYNVDDEKIHVIYNGVDDKYKQIVNNDIKNSIKKKYNLPDDFLLFVGTVEPRKNIERLLDAYLKLDDELREKYPLVIVGKNGWISDKLLKKIEQLRIENKIIRLGYVDFEDLPVIYKLASVFVYLSLYEGFGMPILEAMSSGLPVIASNNSSLGELFNNYALTCNPYSEDEIFNTLNRLLNDKELLASYRELSLKRSEGFSWDNTAKAISKLHNSLMEN